MFIVMKKIILSCIFLCVPFFSYAETDSGVISHTILQDINIYRKAYNLPPIQEETSLCKLATTRVKQVISDWSHDQFQIEIDAIENMNGVFYENLARTYTTKDVVYMWSLSKNGHNETMLRSDMVYGCVAKVGETYAFEGYSPK